MRVAAFAPSRKAVIEDAGGVTAEGFPMTSCYVDSFPAQITVPLIIAVYTQGGTDYEPRRYIIATSPKGDRVSSLEFAWNWPDNPGSPFKFRVFAQHLPLTVQSAGVYTIGLYESRDQADTDHVFPLPVHKLNPLMPPPI